MPRRQFASKSFIPLIMRTSSCPEAIAWMSVDGKSKCLESITHIIPALLSSSNPFISIPYLKYHNKKIKCLHKLFKRSVGKEVESLSSVRDSETFRKPHLTQLVQIFRDLTVDDFD